MSAPQFTMRTMMICVVLLACGSALLRSLAGVITLMVLAIAVGPFIGAVVFHRRGKIGFFGALAGALISTLALLAIGAILVLSRILLGLPTLAAGDVIPIMIVATSAEALAAVVVGLVHDTLAITYLRWRGKLPARGADWDESL
jgi:hypothetical protein